MHNKKSYKTLVLIVKYMPILMSVFIFLRLVLDNVVVTGLLGFIGCTSVLTLTLLFLLAYILQFCWYHTMFIMYMLLYLIFDIILYYSLFSVLSISVFKYVMIFLLPFLLIILFNHLLKKKTKLCL